MTGSRDEDDETINNSSSFMSRNFPDAKPLIQNKLATGAEKTKHSVHKRVDSLPDIDIPPLQLSGNSEINANDELRYQANGVQNRVLRLLKQGRIRPEQRLDLHGQTIEQAHRSTMQFIHECQQQGKYCLLIIHGQGFRSAGGVPVLKQNVYHWLQQLDSVLAFHSAIPADGGRGAVYVLLRKK
jgi:DNA-nicking Smr family endonuclease